MENKNFLGYSDDIQDHFDNPRNVGSLDANDPHVGSGIVGSPSCGDVFKMSIHIDPDTMIIKDIKFKTYGCGTAISSASLTTEKIKGKTLEEAMRITNCSIADELGLPEIKLHCSCLAVNAFHAAVKNWEDKQKNPSGFCKHCGAGIPPKVGEGTCPKCDPDAKS